MMADVVFRFNAAQHEYVELGTGVLFPHITGLLHAGGLVDDTWYTEESSERGTAVHRLTADFDLGALDVESCITRHRAYLLAYVAAVSILRPEILEVELPRVHPVHRYAGRPDREVRIDKRAGVLEIKTAVPASSHQVQTALQAILVADKYDLPPEMFGRWCLYLKPSGKFMLLEHDQRADYERARKLIREFCR